MLSLLIISSPSALFLFYVQGAELIWDIFKIGQICASYVKNFDLNFTVVNWLLQCSWYIFSQIDQLHEITFTSVIIIASF